jgi:hypothetical protein
MIYFKAKWLHSDDHDPVWFYSELDAERWETRKVQIFRSGTMLWADDTTPLDSEIMLGDQQIPPLEEISANPQFEAWEISREDFEAVWNEATKARI